jgi:hypothetical protein
MASEYDDESDGSTSQEGYDGSAGGDGGGSSEGDYNESKAAGPAKGLMLLALLLAVGGGGVYLMSLRAGPATASAATSLMPTDANKAQAAVKQFLAEPNKRGLTLAQLLANTQTVIERFTGYPKQNQVPLAELPGNPFKLAVAGGGGSVDEEEAKKRIEATRMAIAKEAGSLQLQSIIVGSEKPQVIINGESLSPGSHVNGFSVVSIERGKVVVEKAGMRFALCVGK